MSSSTQQQLEELLAGLEMQRLRCGRFPHLSDSKIYLVIPGWGFEIYLQLDPQGQITGWINGTDGG